MLQNVQSLLVSQEEENQKKMKVSLNTCCKHVNYVIVELFYVN